MKTILTLFIILLSLAVSAQTKNEWGIKGGIQTSWFSGGDANYHGIDNAYGSVTAGFFVKRKHIQVELNYLSGGAKNEQEEGRTFKTHYISLPLTYVAHCGDWNFQGGMYVSRLVGASNYDFFTEGPNFGWAVKDWKFYDRWDYGLVGGVGAYIEPIYIEVHYKQGIPNVRNELNGWDNRPDYSYWNCRNASADISLYVPFSTFGK